MALTLSLGSAQTTEADAQVAANLRTFFTKAKGFGPQRAEDRLATFLTAWRLLAERPDRPPPPARPKLEPDGLRWAMHRLGPVIERRRRMAPDLNIWAVIGLGFDEVRSSSVLAWLLNPSGSHGEGARFANALWSAIDGHELGFDLAGLRHSATEVCPLADAADRVDVVLEGDNFAVFIEVKIHAALQPAQLDRYLVAVERSAALRNKAHSALVYLAPNPTRLPSERCRWLTWRRLSRALTAASTDCVSPFVQQAVRQFAQHIERFR